MTTQDFSVTEEAERALLGALLIASGPDSSGVIEAAFGLVRDVDLEIGVNRNIFCALRAGLHYGERADPVLLRPLLEEHGVSDPNQVLSDLIRAAPVWTNLPAYAEAVHIAGLEREVTRARESLAAAATVGRPLGEYLQRLHMAQSLLLDENAEDPSDPDPWTLGNLFNTQFPPIEVLWEDWLQEQGLTLIAGPPSSGKSWLAWAIAYSRASPVGGLLLNAQVSDVPRNVLLVLGEDPDRRAQARLLKLHASGPCPDLDPDDIPLRGIQPPPMVAGRLETPAGLAWLRKRIVRGGFRFVVLDTVTSLTSFALTDDEPVRAFLGALRRMRDELDVDFLLVAHMRKLQDAAKSKGVSHSEDSIYGSVHWRGMTEQIILMGPEDADAQRVRIWRAKTKDLENDAPNLMCRLDKETGRFVVLADLAEPGENRQRFAKQQQARAELSDTALLDALRDAGRAVSRAEWAAAAEVSDSTLKRRISQLIVDAEGLIEESQEGRGGRRKYRYKPSESGSGGSTRVNAGTAYADPLS